jgi:hypothetical protein
MSLFLSYLERSPEVEAINLAAFAPSQPVVGFNLFCSSKQSKEEFPGCDKVRSMKFDVPHLFRGENTEVSASQNSV